MIDHIADLRFSMFFININRFTSLFRIGNDEVDLRRGECWVVDIELKCVMITDPCAKSIVRKRQ